MAPNLQLKSTRIASHLFTCITDSREDVQIYMFFCYQEKWLKQIFTSWLCPKF